MFAAKPQAVAVTDAESGHILAARFDNALETVASVRERWRGLLEHLDEAVSQHQNLVRSAEHNKLRTGETLVRALLRTSRYSRVIP